MHINLRKIGNSRGVIIPSAIIEQLKIETGLELIVEENAITLRPLHNPRSGWFDADAYDPKQDDDPLADIKALDSESDDWEW